MAQPLGGRWGHRREERNGPLRVRSMKRGGQPGGGGGMMSGIAPDKPGTIKSVDPHLRSTRELMKQAKPGGRKVVVNI